MGQHRERHDPPCILVVEDVAVQVKLTQMCLARAGYEVQFALTGDEALERVQAYRPDLILLDVDIPGLNGFQVLDRLRNNSNWQTIPVIMLTAHAKDEPLFQEWAQETDVFMTKPFSPVELVHTVQNILASYQNTGEAIAAC